MTNRVSIMLTAAAVSLGVLACTPSRDAEDSATLGVAPSQRNSLAIVQLRSQDLRPGMTKADVYNLLGAPSAYGDTGWTYRGDGGTLVVRFDGDRYVSHN